MVRKTFLLLAASASLIALAACSPQQQQQPPVAQSQTPPQPLYASLNECQQAGNNPQLCQQAFTNAQANTPRYNSFESCAAQYGPSACRDNGGWFGPALAGFMIGTILANNSNGYYMGGHYTYDYGYYHRYYNRPAYVTHVVVYPTTSYASHYYATTHTTPPAPVPPTVTRGGFSNASPPTATRAATPSASAPVSGSQLVTANRGGTGFGTANRPPAMATAAAPSRPSFGGGFGASRSSGFGGSSSHSSFGSSSHSFSSHSSGSFG